MFALYDDHEVADNWDASFRAEHPARVAAALRAWDEWFPLWADTPVERRYRRWRWGSLSELFLLDTRLYRSANSTADGPDKTMLGLSTIAS